MTDGRCTRRLARVIALAAMCCPGAAHAEADRKAPMAASAPGNSATRNEYASSTSCPAADADAQLIVGPIPPEATPQNIAGLRDALEMIEASGHRLPSKGPINIHQLKLDYYGALVLALAQKGEWEPATMLGAKNALLESRKRLRYGGGQKGMTDIVEACELLERWQDALYWQQEVVAYWTFMKPGHGVGLTKLADLCLRCGKKRDAVAALEQALVGDHASPGDYIAVFIRLSEIEGVSAATAVLENGVRRFEDARRLAAHKFEGQRVFVDKEKWEGLADCTFYDLADPSIIQSDDSAAVRRLQAKGFIDVTTQAADYENEKAQADLSKMRHAYERLLPRMKQEEGRRAQTRSSGT